MTVCPVSVIIPAHNCESCLSLALDSALAQEPRPAQIIVVNDGSTDGTADAARNYGGGIVLLEQENRGQGAARNAGLAVAAGEYVAFLDSDDYWKPGFLASCVRFLERHPEACAVGTMLIMRNADGTERILPQSLDPRLLTSGPFVIDRFFDFWAEHDHLRTGANLIRMSVIREAGGQRDDLRISQDLEYWAYIATFGRWGFIPEPLWVGNSRASAAAPGWLNKYRKRRRLCPTVESWEERVVPRLKPEDRAGFDVVRGRVAAGYAHAKILAGALEDARQIVLKHGPSMPANRLASLMRWGARNGRMGWWGVCRLAQAKELLKAWRLSLRKTTGSLAP